MAGKRQSEPASERVAEIFARELREASGRVISHMAHVDRVNLKDVYQAHVWAAFDLLEMALRARRMYGGKLPPAAGSAPAARIAERAAIFEEIMELISDELISVDPAHDYVVALGKRRKGVHKG